jgi:nanoRNase/pAp phosphatase (c-di-AMP/oligoRNAs hydrolase)
MRKPKPEHERLMAEIVGRLRRSKSTVACGHVNADPDAIGAAIALAESFPNVTVAAFTGMNKSAARVASALGYQVAIDPDVRAFETVVVCDATSPSQLNCNDPSLYKEAIFMDHHQPSNFAGTPFYWSDARYRATCEMALALIRTAGVPLTEKARVALLGGLLTDTGRFKFNDEPVFAAVDDLFFGGPEGPPREGLYQYARQLVEETGRDASEITANLKGLQRAQWVRAGEWFLAWTAVSAFESNLSALLVASGADVSVAFAERGGLVRGSARATRAAEKAGLNLGAIFRDFRSPWPDVAWDGGGHAAAAGFSAEAPGGGAGVPGADVPPLSPETARRRAEIDRTIQRLADREQALKERLHDYSRELRSGAMDADQRAAAERTDAELKRGEAALLETLRAHRASLLEPSMGPWAEQVRAAVIGEISRVLEGLSPPQGSAPPPWEIAP